MVPHDRGLLNLPSSAPSASPPCHPVASVPRAVPQALEDGRALRAGDCREKTHVPHEVQEAPSEHLPRPKPACLKEFMTQIPVCLLKHRGTLYTKESSQSPISLDTPKIWTSHAFTLPTSCLFYKKKMSLTFPEESWGLRDHPSHAAPHPNSGASEANPRSEAELQSQRTLDPPQGITATGEEKHVCIQTQPISHTSAHQHRLKHNHIYTTQDRRCRPIKGRKS